MTNLSKLEAKQIADAHFAKNYNYYRTICYRCYRGRYLYEDLLNESYLKFIEKDPDVLLKFHREGRPERHIEDRFRSMVKLIIIETFRNRGIKSNRCINGETNNSSPLFETPSINLDYDFIAEEPQKNEVEIQNHFLKAVSAINKALQEPVKEGKKKSDWLKVRVFLEVEKTNINKLSKQTGISRPFITQTYIEGQKLLQKEITK